MTKMKDLREALGFVCSVDFWRMAVLWTFTLLVSYLQLLGLFGRKTKSYPRRFVPSQTSAVAAIRPVCVITGATSGLGAAAALAMSREGFNVVMAGRSSHLLSKMIKEIKQQNPDAHVKAIPVDLLSFQSMIKFKGSLEQWLLDSNMPMSIQLLINNAGILATSRRFTTEGYDQMMATNYLGAFSLTNLLLPLLRNSSIPSRIVNVTSFTHRCVSDVLVDYETVAGKCFSTSNGYQCARIYEFSKLCLLLFSYELHRQLVLADKSHKLSVIAVDPGAVETKIMREVPSCLSRLAFTALKFLRLLQSAENGVNSVIDAALAPPEISGEYFFGGRGRTIESSSLSYDANLSRKLWTSSLGLSVMGAGFFLGWTVGWLLRTF